MNDGSYSAFMEARNIEDVLDERDDWQNPPPAREDAPIPDDIETHGEIGGWKYCILSGDAKDEIMIIGLAPLDIIRRIARAYEWGYLDESDTGWEIEYGAWRWAPSQGDYRQLLQPSGRQSRGAFFGTLLMLSDRWTVRPECPELEAILAEW